MSQQSFFTPETFVPVSTPQNTSFLDAAMAGQAIADQFRAEQANAVPSTADPAIIAHAITRGLSSDQKQALDRDTYDAIYNRKDYELRFGKEAAAKLDNQVQQYISADDFAIDNRSPLRQVGDIALGMAQGVGQMGLGLASVAAIPGSDLSQTIARWSNDLTEWSNQLGSSYRQATARANATKQTARDALSELQWKQDKAKGDSDFYAGLKQLGRDVLTGTKNFFTDPNAAEQGISNALGSLLMAGPLSKGLSVAGKALSKGTSQLAKDISKHLMTTEGRTFAAKVFGNEGLTNALLEMGGSVEGAIASVDALTSEQLLANPQFVKQVDKYVNQGLSYNEAYAKAKNDLAGSVARWAAGITSLIAAPAGAFADKIIRNPLGLDSWSPLIKAPGKLAERGAKEFIEEGVQGFQQMGENIGMKQAGFEDTHLWSGVGQEIAQGALAGGVSGAGGPIIGTPIAVAKAATSNKAKTMLNATRDIIEEGKQFFSSVQETSQKEPVSEKMQTMAEQFSNVISEFGTTPIATINSDLAEQNKESLSEITKASINESKTISENIIALQDIAQKLSKSKNPEDHVAAKQILDDIGKLTQFTQMQSTVMADFASRDPEKNAETEADKRLFKELQSIAQGVQAHIESPTLKANSFEKLQERVNSLKGVTLYAEDFLHKAAQEKQPENININEMAGIVRNIINEQATPKMKEAAIPAIDNVLKRTDLSETNKAIFTAFRDILQNRAEVLQNFAKTDTTSGSSKRTSQIVSDLITKSLGGKSKGTGLEYLSLNGHLNKIINRMIGVEKGDPAEALADFERLTQSQINKLDAMNKSFALPKEIKKTSQRKISYAAYSKNPEKNEYDFVSKDIFVDPNSPSSMDLYQQAKIETQLLIGTQNALAKAFSGSKAINEKVLTPLSINQVTSIEDLQNETKANVEASTEGTIIKKASEQKENQQIEQSVEETQQKTIESKVELTKKIQKQNQTFQEKQEEKQVFQEILNQIDWNTYNPESNKTMAFMSAIGNLFYINDSQSLIHKLHTPIDTLTQFFNSFKTEDKYEDGKQALLTLLTGNKHSQQLTNRIFAQQGNLAYINHETLLHALQNLFSSSDKSALTILTKAFNDSLQEALHSKNKKIKELIAPLKDIDLENAGQIAFNLEKKNINSLVLFLTQNKRKLEADNSFFQKALLGYLSAYISKTKELVPGNQEENTQATSWEIQVENNALQFFNKRYSFVPDVVQNYLRQNLDNSTTAIDFTNSIVSMLRPYLGLKERANTDTNLLNNANTCFVQTMNDILLKEGLLQKHSFKVEQAILDKDLPFALPEVIRVTDNGKVIYQHNQYTEILQKSKKAETKAKKQNKQIDPIDHIQIEEISFYQAKEPNETSDNVLEQSFASIYHTIGSSILNRLFLAQANESFLLNEIPEIDKTIHNIQTKLSDNQKESLKARQEKEYFFNKSMYNLISLAGETVLSKYLGKWFPSAKENKKGIDANETLLNQYTDITRASMQGKQTNIHTSFLNLDYIFKELLAYPGFEDPELGLASEGKSVSYDTLPIHFKYMIAATGRHMIQGGMHPQGDKILREVILPKAYKLDLTDAVNRENYFRGIAQAFGIKVQRYERGPEIEQKVWDKMKTLSQIPEWKRFVQLSQINPSLANLGSEEKSIIQSLLIYLTNQNDIDRTMITLHALFDMAKIYDLEKHDIQTDKLHTSQFYLEADGISSGAANSILLFDTSPLWSDGKADYNRIQYLARAGLGIGFRGSYAQMFQEIAGDRDIYGALGFSLQEFINNNLAAANRVIKKLYSYNFEAQKRDLGISSVRDLVKIDEQVSPMLVGLEENAPDIIDEGFSVNDPNKPDKQLSVLHQYKRYKQAYSDILSLFVLLQDSGQKELSGIKAEEDALGELNKFLIDRGFIKGPLTQIQYGASSMTVAKAIVKAMEEAIAQKISEFNIAKNIEQNEEKAQKLEKQIIQSIDKINSLAKNSFYQKFNKNTKKYNLVYNSADPVFYINFKILKEKDPKLLHFSFDSYQKEKTISHNPAQSFSSNLTLKNRLEETINSLITTPLSEQIETNIYGKEFSTNKKMLVGLSNTLTIFSSQLFIEKLKALIKANNGYTSAQYKHLQNLLKKWEPLIKNNITAFIETRKDSSDESIFESQEIQQTFNMFKQDFLGHKELNTQSFGGSLNDPFHKEGEQSILVPSNAGVSLLPKTVQGMAESVIMQIMSLKKATGLDVFDGFNMPINQVNELAKLANEAVYNAWVNTNVFKSMNQAIDTFFENFADDELAKKILNKMFQIKNHPIQEEFNRNIKSLIKALNLKKNTNWLDALAAARKTLAIAAQKTDIKQFMLKHFTDLSVDQMGGAAIPFFHKAEAIDFTFKDGTKFEPIRFENFQGNNALQTWLNIYAEQYQNYVYKLQQEEKFDLSKYQSKIFNDQSQRQALNFKMFNDEAHTLADLVLSDVSDLNSEPAVKALNWAITKFSQNNLKDKNIRAVIKNIQNNIPFYSKVKIARLKPSDMNKESILSKYFRNIDTTQDEMLDVSTFIADSSKRGLIKFFDNNQIVILVKDEAAFNNNSETKKEDDKKTAKVIVHEALHAYVAAHIYSHIDDNGSIINTGSLEPDELVNLQYLKKLFDQFKDFPEIKQSESVKQLYQQIFQDTPIQQQIVEFISYALTEPELENLLSNKSVNYENTLIAKMKEEESKTTNFLGRLKTLRKGVQQFLGKLFHWFQQKLPSTFLDELRFSVAHILISNKDADNALQDYYSIENISFNASFWATDPIQEELKKKAEQYKKEGYPSNRILDKVQQIQQWAKEQNLQENTNKADFNYIHDINNSTTHQIINNISALFHLTTQQCDDFTDYLTLLIQASHKDKTVLQRGYALNDSFYDHLSKDLFSGTEQERLDKYYCVTNLPNYNFDGNTEQNLAVPVLIALNEVSPEFQGITSKLDIPKRYKKSKEDSINDILRGIGNNVLDTFTKVMSNEGTRVTKQDEAMKIVAQEAAAIAHDSKTRVSDYLSTKFNDMLSLADKHVSNILYKTTDTLRRQLLKLHPDTKLGQAAKAFISTPLVAATAVFNEHADTSGAFIRNTITNSKVCPEWARKLIHDMMAPMDETLTSFYLKHKELKAKIDQDKQTTKSRLPEELKKFFEQQPGKKRPSDDEWESLHLSLGRTDVACFDNPIFYKKIADWVSEPEILLKEIASMEEELGSLHNKDIIFKKAKQLAHFMVTNEAGVELQRNPFAILKLNNALATSEQLVILDKLISLYALSELPQKDKKILLKLFNENKEAIIKLLNVMNQHRQIEYQDKKNLLDSSLKDKDTLYYQKMRVQLNYYKGYIPTVRTDGTSLIVADSKDIKELQQNGWMYLGDYGDRTSGKSYYYSNFGHQAIFNEGLIRIVHSTYNGIAQDTGNSIEGVAFIKRRTKENAIAFDKMTQSLLSQSSGSKTGEDMIPVYGIDKDGNMIITAWEARMSPDMISMIQNKRNLADMIGMWASRQKEEQFAKQYNSEAANILIDLYQKASDEEKHKSFINILDMSQLSKTQQDAVKLIPWDVLEIMKDEFMQKTGQSGIFIRRDVFIDAVGERSASVADIFSNASNIDEKTLGRTKQILLKLLGKKAFQILMAGEQIIQGAVSLARNCIVIKSIKVMLLNNIGNIWHLGACGVPLKTIMKELPIFLAETEAYAQSFQKLVALQTKQDATRDPEEKAKLEARIKLKKAEIQNMTIYPILHEFSVLEDLGRTEDDLKLTRGKIGEWIDTQVKRYVPNMLMTPLKYLFLTKDTAAYQFLEKATQYGDFIAKGILYKHLISKEHYTKQQALERINTEFVNYDMNPGRVRSYIENTGLAWFWNYKLRIIPVAIRTLRQHPVRALFMSIFPQWSPVGDTGNVINDSFLGKLFGGKLGNSIGWSMLWRGFTMHPAIAMA